MERKETSWKERVVKSWTSCAILKVNRGETIEIVQGVRLLLCIELTLNQSPEPLMIPQSSPVVTSE